MFSALKKFKDALKGTAAGALGGIASLFSKKLSPDDIGELEDSLLGSDFGYETTSEIMKSVKDEYARNRELRGKDAAEIGAAVLEKILSGANGDFKRAAEGFPTVICLVGVNGAGKTTTAAKLAYMIRKKFGEDVLIGSCDTFRAAANAQLKEWAGRVGVDLVESRQGGDSAATAWDAWHSAKARGFKWLILDTAGRLHTKENLMAELAKIRRVLSKNDPDAPHNSIIVIDGSLGSNSIEQAKAFDKAFGLTGMIVTKLDGTGKGGAVAGIYRTLKIPILCVGLGEKTEDLQDFDVRAYSRGVFGLE